MRWGMVKLVGMSCKRWQKQQSGNRLVFQDALGQQSGCFGAIAVALAAVGVRWVRRRCGGQVDDSSSVGGVGGGGGSSGGGGARRW